MRIKCSIFANGGKTVKDRVIVCIGNRKESTDCLSISQIWLCMTLRSDIEGHVFKVLPLCQLPTDFERHFGVNIMKKWDETLRHMVWKCWKHRSRDAILSRDANNARMHGLHLCTYSLIFYYNKFEFCVCVAVKWWTSLEMLLLLLLLECSLKRTRIVNKN